MRFFRSWTGGRLRRQHRCNGGVDQLLRAEEKILSYGILTGAAAGMNSMLGYKPGDAYEFGITYADPVAGQFGTYSVIAAMINKNRTGAGQYIDLSSAAPQSRWSTKTCRATSRITLGADKAYDTADFVATCRALNITPVIGGHRRRLKRHAAHGC